MKKDVLSVKGFVSATSVFGQTTWPFGIEFDKSIE